VYVVPHGKVCGWNGFFARSGDRFASKADEKDVDGVALPEIRDKDGQPLPHAVIERFVRMGNFIEVNVGPRAVAPPASEVSP